MRYGWITREKTGRPFHLENTCKSDSCEANGWVSDDSTGTHYDVTCKADGCFVDGWLSVGTKDGIEWRDDVKCIASDCLRYGWDIGNDVGGGEATCLGNDCRNQGGQQTSRDMTWSSTCSDGDCYHVGWETLVFFM